MKHKYIVALGIAILCIVFIALCVAMATPAAAYEGDPIWTNRMLILHYAADMLREAGFSDDSEPIRALSAEWWREQENLDIIAKVVAHEADPQWCEWEHSVAVAVVVLNRVASPYFPNTVKEVVAAPGQYLPSYTWGFENTPRLCYEVAAAAMNGEHDVPEDAYWQDNKIQGTSIWKSFVCDTGWFKSTTYICRGIVWVN